VSGDDRQSDVTQARRLELADAFARAGLGEHRIADAAVAWKLLAEVPLFSKLGRRDLHRLAECSQIVRYAPGEPIVLEGFSAEAFFVLFTGQALVKRHDGREVLLGRGQFFGELGLIDGASRSASVVADGPVTAFKVRREGFLRLLDTQPSVGRGLVESLVERLREAEAEVPPGV
jgi:CRP-like cAMP-binding protein